MSFIELTPTLEVPSYLSSSVLGYRFSDRDLENMEGILSSDLCKNGLEYSTVVNNDYNINVGGMSFHEIASEYKQSLYLNFEMFEDE